MSTLEELGSRAVACRQWRWMHGMLTLAGHRVICTSVGGYLRVYWPVQLDWSGGFIDRVIADEQIPDLSDPATIGCLLHLVREAWGKNIYVQHWEDCADASLDHCNVMHHGKHLLQGDFETEAEALVAALEAAP